MSPRHPTLLITILLAALFAAISTSALPILQQGDLCGFACKSCTALPHTCGTGLICVKTATGCAAGYQGTCQPKCSANGRNKEQCLAVGNHCQFLGLAQFTQDPKCGLGCHLKFEHSTFNPAETCGEIPCKTSCNSATLSPYCKWNDAGGRCEALVNSNTTTTARCWADCPKFPPGNAAQPCPECTKNLEYEYETNANAYCWNFIDQPATDTLCKKVTTLANCNKNTKCEWSRAAPTNCPTALRPAICHEKDFCGYTCKAACLQYPKRCRWSDALGACRHNLVSHGPTTRSPTTLTPTKKLTQVPTLKPTKGPSVHPTKKPTNPTTSKPTKKITVAPTKKPTKPTTMKPTKVQTPNPTKRPTTLKPTKPTTQKPTTLTPTTLAPTASPTSPTTWRPTTKSPTLKPTKVPTAAPTTNSPTTKTPTNRPTTKSPTSKPTKLA